MKSPFPGMDPYLEQRWGDLHVSLITYIRDAIQPLLGADLRARSGERIYLESLDSESRQFLPDVHVLELPRASRGAGGAAAVAEELEVAEPIIVRTHLEVTERFLQIIDVRTGGKVVTVLEILSPSNKTTGRGREEYLKKQSECVQSGVNLVEIDLVRSGKPTTLLKPTDVPPGRVAHYHASVFRAAKPAELAYYPLPLKQRLPRLPIPLRATDRDVALDLQAVLDTAYDRGRYDDIDYSAPLRPSLDPADEQWARGLLAASGLIPR
jgi:hypothetical protein